MKKLLLLLILLLTNITNASEVTLGHIETYSGVYYNDVSYDTDGLRLAYHNEELGNIYKIDYTYDIDNWFAFYRMNDDKINKRFSSEVGVGYGQYIYEGEYFKIKPSLANMFIDGELNLSGRLKIKANIDCLEGTNVTNLIVPLGEVRNNLAISLKLTSGVFFVYSKDYMSNNEYQTGSANLGLKIKF